jgi:uridine kinase
VSVPSARLWERRAAEVAEVVLWIALNSQPTLGDARLVCIDGRTGSGKSTLGEALHATAAEVGTSALIHLDDLLDGWEGLGRVSRTLEDDVLEPLREGRPGRYRRYDWLAEQYAEECVVDPVDLLVVEGVGSGASSYSSWVTTLVWVDAPSDLGLARSVARDGEAIRPQLLRWMQDEDALFVREHTRDRADLVVDGTGEADDAVVLT